MGRAEDRPLETSLLMGDGMCQSEVLELRGHGGQHTIPRILGKILEGILCSRVIFRPDPLEFIEVVGSKDRPISG